MNATIRRLVFVPMFLALAAGCGSKGNPNAPAIVTGKVSYKGAPVTGGNIQFRLADQGIYSSAISSDGKYRIAQVPAGEAVVTIETESINPDKGKDEKGGGLTDKYKGMMSGPPSGAKVGNAGAYVKIPSKYADPKTSGLTYTIQGGDQKKDWDLTD